MQVASDYKDMLSALAGARVEFLVVGAYAVIAHSVPRFTKDIDIWVKPSPDNAPRVLAALADFGAPLEGITAKDFAHPGPWFQIGVAPVRIDVLTSVGSLDFGAVWSRRVAYDFDGVPGFVPAAEDLIAMKREAGRPRDLLDIAWLEKARARHRARADDNA